MELTIPCDRCLEEVKVPVAIHIEREAELSDGVLVPDSDEETDTFLQGEQLDVDRLIDDEILVNWPTKVLCREDCKGICPKCGQNLNQRTADATVRSWIREWQSSRMSLKNIRRCNPMSICPKNKSSKGRRDKRRANWKMSAPTLVKCSKCGELMMPHRVCKNCGSYNKKEIIPQD